MKAEEDEIHQTAMMYYKKLVAKIREILGNKLLQKLLDAKPDAQDSKQTPQDGDLLKKIHDLVNEGNVERDRKETKILECLASQMERIEAFREEMTNRQDSIVN